MNAQTPLQQPSTETPNLRLTLLVALVLAIIAVFIGREVYGRLIVPAPPLNFDEAAHSLPGYYIMRDVLRLDARAFWGDTHIQTLWPPGFSYLQAPVLLILGRTDAAARVFSYIALVLAMLMGVAITWAIRPGNAPLAAFVSGLIALSAPGWLSLGGLALQETPVALVAFVVFFLFLRAQRTQRVFWFTLTGFAWFFLFLTKYNYAAFALASMLLVDAGERLRRAMVPQRVGTQPPVTSPGPRPGTAIGRLFAPKEIATLAALYLPVLLGLAFWFYGGTDIVPTAVKWRDFQFFVTNENSGYAFWSEQNLLFYVRAAANWLMPHPLVAVLVLLGSLWAVVRIRHRGVALLALFFLIGFVLATIHPLKADRYVAPVFPSLWVLAGLGAADLTKHFSLKHASTTQVAPSDPGPLPISNLQSPIPFLQSTIVNQQSSMAAAVLIVAMVVMALASWLTWLPQLHPVWYGGVADGLQAASNQIVAWQQPERPVLIIGTFGELSPPLFEWRLRPQPAYANGNIQYDAPPGEGSEIERVEHWLQANPGTQVTLITLDKNTVLYNTADMQNKNAWRQTLVEQFNQVKGYQLVQSIAYPGAGLVVSYYLPR